MSLSLINDVEMIWSSEIGRATSPPSNTMRVAEHSLNSQWAVRTNGRPHHSSPYTGYICVTAAVGCRQHIFISLSAASQGSVLSPCPDSLFSAFHSTLSCLLQSPVGVIQFSLSLSLPLSLSLEGTSLSLISFFVFPSITLRVTGTPPLVCCLWGFFFFRFLDKAPFLTCFLSTRIRWHVSVDVKKCVVVVRP